MKKKILLSVLAVILILVFGVLFAYRNFILTALSLKELDDAPVYHLTVYGDCWLEECMETDIKSTEELNRFLMEKTTFGIKKDYSAPHKACSAFFAVSPEGDYLLCNNVDLLYPSLRAPTIIEANILDRHSITMGDASITMRNMVGGILGDMSLYYIPYSGFGGINEDGLAVAVASAYGSYMLPTEGKTYMFDPAVTQMVLSNAGSVDEAVEFLRGYNVKTDKGTELFHYLLADSTGKSVIIEWEGDMKVIESDTDYQAMSNFRMTKMSGYGKDRYNGLIAGLEEKNGVVTEDEALQLLKANRIKDAGFVSVVYNLTRKTAAVYFSEADKVMTFELTD